MTPGKPQTMVRQSLADLLDEADNLKFVFIVSARRSPIRSDGLETSLQIYMEDLVPGEFIPVAMYLERGWADAREEMLAQSIRTALSKGGE